MCYIFTDSASTVLKAEWPTVFGALAERLTRLASRLIPVALANLAGVQPPPPPQAQPTIAEHLHQLHTTPVARWSTLPQYRSTMLKDALAQLVGEGE